MIDFIVFGLVVGVVARLLEPGPPGAAPGHHRALHLGPTRPEHDLAQRFGPKRTTIHWNRTPRG